MNSNLISNSITNNDYSMSNTSRSIPSPSLIKSLFQSDENSISETAPYAQIIQKMKYERTVSEESIVDAVNKANKAIMGEPKKFEYSVHKGFGDIVVKIINAETNEVIKEIPPEKLLDIVQNLEKISGAIIDERR
jgi:flagellar protein FlaG